MGEIEQIRLDLALHKAKPIHDGAAEQLAQVNAKLDSVIALLTGNGSPEKGIIVRLDRLEQDARVWDKIISAVIAAAVALGFGFFQRKG